MRCTRRIDAFVQHNSLRAGGVAAVRAVRLWNPGGDRGPCAWARVPSGTTAIPRRSTGEIIERDRKSGADWTRFSFPAWWYYDVLRGLDYLRDAGITPDERVAEAIELVVSKRQGDGRWLLDTQYPGVLPIQMHEFKNQSSRWNTLRAMRVLRWYENA